MIQTAHKPDLITPKLFITQICQPLCICSFITDSIHFKIFIVGNDKRRGILKASSWNWTDLITPISPLHIKLFSLLYCSNRVLDQIFYLPRFLFLLFFGSKSCSFPATCEDIAVFISFHYVVLSCAIIVI